MALNEKNVVLMLGVEQNRFYLSINEQLIATPQTASNYHAHLWIKDPEYREKTARLIIAQNIHLLEKNK